MVAYFPIIFWAALFTGATVVSVVLIGARDLIGGEITFSRMLAILFDWRFLLGALFAFFARVFFIMINNSVYKIPELADTSTTITFFVTVISLFFVVIANHYFLGEHMSSTQILGGGIILIGIFLLFSGA